MVCCRGGSVLIVVCSRVCILFCDVIVFMFMLLFICLICYWLFLLLWMLVMGMW